MSQGVRRLNNSLEVKNHEQRNIPLAQTVSNIPRARKSHQENSFNNTSSPFMSRDMLSPKSNVMYQENSVSYHNINKELINPHNHMSTTNYVSNPQRHSHRDNSYI